MKELNPIEKLDTLIQEAWEIFMAQFIGGRIHVATEAPFQHYLANVIKSLGDLYCFSRTETFLVDLETREGETRYNCFIKERTHFQVGRSWKVHKLMYAYTS